MPIREVKFLYLGYKLEDRLAIKKAGISLPIIGEFIPKEHCGGNPRGKYSVICYKKCDKLSKLITTLPCRHITHVSESEEAAFRAEIRKEIAKIFG